MPPRRSPRGSKRSGPRVERAPERRRLHEVNRGRGPASRRLAAATVVLALTAAFFADRIAAGHAKAAEAYEPEYAAGRRRVFDQFECLDRQLNEGIPRGTRVTIDAGLTDDLWRQRLAEFAFPRLTLVDEPARGVVVITVEPDVSPGSCKGLRAGRPLAAPAP